MPRQKAIITLPPIVLQEQTPRRNPYQGTGSGLLTQQTYDTGSNEDTQINPTNMPPYGGLRVHVAGHSGGLLWHELNFYQQRKVYCLTDSEETTT